MKRGRDDAIAAMGDDNNDRYPLGEEDEDGVEEEDRHQQRAACDVLLSLSCGSSSGSSSTSGEEEAAGTAAVPPLNKRLRRRRRGRDDAFECRTCGRKFMTFQALGGHRSSHLRRPPATKLRPKEVAVHACGTCGLGFSTGQALGGHMRRHRGPTTTEDDFGYVGLPQIIMQQDRPSSASLPLLNLFV
ncbi:hypothetical protein SETIT_8G247200v2 [Setaria italica]|uniref:C2H2-type domain-containing protein n=2 Tax=Setaria italica TaxID=4555 RepID=A0A368SBB6_SETIT|nr:zinc finger protein ZAT11 [Setaria italica]RCV39737.1 hypothetical protein SETIT_8G247200v2 [Setaria italica]